jgi:ABC-type nitrate/sulfonate/bicarbonate transport system substrate-binding protein
MHVTLDSVMPDTAQNHVSRRIQGSPESTWPKTMTRTTALTIWIALSLLTSCGDADRLPLNVDLGGRSVSKLPYVIAADQGLFEKYGLDVTIRLPRSDNGRGIESDPGRRLLRRWFPWERDVLVDGLTPNIVKQVERAGFPQYVAVASNDCIVRAHIVAQPDITRIEDLKGKRIGISARRDTTTGYAALAFADRMGWDPDFDIAIRLNGRDMSDLVNHRVDAIVASETRYAAAVGMGYSILEDTQQWNEALGGNSVMADAAWLENPVNREKIRRLVMATVEGLALFHNDKALALDVLERWYGLEDPSVREAIYERGQWMPRKPYPCYEGTVNTLKMYDSLAMRGHAPTDFYDDSIVRELDESGFIDAFYQ